MKKALKSIIVLIIMMTCVLPSDAADYRREWKAVDDFIEQDFPETAYEKVQEIFRKAEAKGDDYQMLRSCVYMAMLGAEYQENYYKEVFDCLNGMMPRLDGIYEPLGWAILGNCYREFYNRNRYSIHGRERLETPSPDVELWDEQTWQDTIKSCLYKSFTISADLTAKTSCENLDRLIEPGNDYGVRLCPSLLAALLYNAIDFESDREVTEEQAGIYSDVRLYGTAEEFIQLADEYAASKALPWNIGVMARYARLCADSPDYDVRANADKERFELFDSRVFFNAGTASVMSGRRAAGLLRLANDYFDRTSISALMIADYADIFYGGDRYESQYAGIVALCEKFADRWPESEGAYKCRSMIRNIRQQEIYMQMSPVMSPDGSLVGVTCRNVPEIYFKCVRDEDMQPLSGFSGISGNAGEYRNLKAAAEWTVKVENADDYRTRRVMVHVPSLPVGKYCIIASTDTLFEEKTTRLVSYDIELHSFTFNACVPDNGSGTACGFVVDRITGMPLQGYEYSVWKLEGTYYDRKRTGRVAHGVTEADGAVSLDVTDRNMNMEIEVCGGGDTIVSDFYVYHYPDRPEPVIARIYTDRYSYRPGETVSFNCIVYQNNGYSNGHTVADADLRVTLYDVNWQEVDTLSVTTDRFGTASGSFVIPRNLLAGRFTLQVEGADEDFSSYRPINVEEFRQPVFMVEMGSEGRSYVPGDTAVVSGTAVTYTGIPVVGAKVSCTVEYVEPLLFRNMRMRDVDRQILSAETVTDEDGRFSISFVASAELASAAGRESLDFKVTARVTDINGETHSSSAYVTAGRPTPYLTLMSSWVYTDAPSLSILLENAGGDLIEGEVNVCVERLTPVEKPLLPANEFAGLNGFEVSDGIREKFPLYSFDKTDYNARPVEECVYETAIRTEAGAPYMLNLPEPLQNGLYRFIARVEGVESSDTAFFVSVLPDCGVMPDDELLVVSPLKRQYKVGETVEILIGSAFAGVPVYYIVENRFGFVENGVLYPDGAVTRLSFKVTDEMRGGISVHCAAMKSLISKNRSVNIEVPYTDRELDIKLVTFRDMLEPDRTETWSMSIRDCEGRPVEAALTLTMFDSALDAYGQNEWVLSPWNVMDYSSNSIIGSDMQNVRQRSFAVPQTDYPVFDGESPEFPEIVSPFDLYLFFGTRGKLVSANRMHLTGSLSMTEFEGLGITTADAALQGSVRGLDVVSNSGAVLEESAFAVAPDNPDVQDGIAVRTDQNPTAFFMTGLRTDSNGEVSFSFTVPQLLTKWHFQGIAHTEDLKSAVFTEQVTTRKQLMLQPRAPRFVRQGDELVLSARVSNITDADMTARVRLELFDAASGKSLDIVSGASDCDVNVPAGGSAAASFKLTVPDGITAMTYRMTAAADSHTDGQQEIIPVLSSRAVMTESVSLFNNGNETRDFELKAVSENLLSETARDRTLTLEYTSSPVWYAIQALPYLEENDNPSNECLFHRYFASALSSHVIATRPAVGRMLAKWAEIPADEWQTQLERNGDLKQTLLQETPWVLDSKDEKENLHRLAEAFAQDRLERDLSSALNELLQRQEPAGGWSWISGYLPSFWVTGTIVSGFAELVNMGYLNPDEEPELREALSSALHWLDNEIKDNYSKVKRKDVKTVSPDELDWLLAHIALKEIGLAPGSEDIHDLLMSVALKEDTRGMSLYKRASMALLMSATGNEKRAQQLVSTLVERSLYDEEQGRWWRDNTGGFLWHESPIETQSRIIEAMLAVGGRETEAAECGRWLLKQRQTTHWATSPATAKAVIALLKVGDRQGVSLDAPAVSYITIGGETIKAGGEDADAGYIIRKWQEPSDPAMGKVSVRNDSPETGWGALSVQYTEEMVKGRYSANGISLKRTLYRVDEKSDGTVLHEVAEGEALHVGDRLRIRIELGCDRNLEYVELKDMRAASFEPVSTRAGFRYNLHDDLRTYVVPQNASQVFYIDRLNRGSYIIEYDVYAEQAGTFSSGIVSAQCMYAPEFRSAASSCYRGQVHVTEQATCSCDR